MKRLASILCSGLLLVIATAALANNPTSNVFEPIEKGNPTQVPGGWTDTGGETIATATLIGSLPYTDSDNTCGHTADYVASCGANAAPDLFYRYVPATNQTINLSLCGSSFDTVLYILENGNPLSCNDDFCGLQSEIDGVALVAGRTYTIGVSGFSTNCGPYTLNITRAVDCLYSCLPGSLQEGEPICFAGYTDNYNGGCNSTPTIWQAWDNGCLCGTMGTYTSGLGDTRDTDWFVKNLVGGNYVYNGMAENNFQTARYVLTPVCPPSLIGGPGVNCGPINVTLSAGQTWFFCAPTVFTGVPCGTRYWLTVDGPGITPCGATAVEPTTWGTIKNNYR